VNESFFLLILVPGIPIAAFFGWAWWFLRKVKRTSRLPFVDMPRPPGWSLQNRTTDLMFEACMGIMIAFAIGAIAWALDQTVKEPPLLFLISGFGACSIMLIRSARILVRARNHHLGLLGEQVVGQILDSLSSDSVRVFHDLEIRDPGGKPRNIDHVVLSPAGVFAIETKTRRKPRASARNGESGHRLTFDGHRLIFPHPMKPDRYGLEQAFDNATWLAAKLSALNGCPISVTPALVFPGWWVDAKGKGQVSVLNHKQLPGYLAGRAAVLSAERQRAIANQLSERSRIELVDPG